MDWEDGKVFYQVLGLKKDCECSVCKKYYSSDEIKKQKDGSLICRGCIVEGIVDTTKKQVELSYEFLEKYFEEHEGKK